MFVAVETWTRFAGITFSKKLHRWDMVLVESNKGSYQNLLQECKCEMWLSICHTYTFVLKESCNWRTCPTRCDAVRGCPVFLIWKWGWYSKHIICWCSFFFPGYSWSCNWRVGVCDYFLQFPLPSHREQDRHGEEETLAQEDGRSLSKGVGQLFSASVGKSYSTSRSQ